MDYTLAGLKPNEIASIVFGVVGMVLALVSYRRAGRSEILAKESNARALKSERLARDLAFANRKSEVLSTARAGVVAHMATVRKLRRLVDDAKEAGATLIEPEAEKLLAATNNAVAGLRKMETEIQAVHATEEDHEQLMSTMNRNLAQLQGVSDPSLIAEEVAPILDQMERNIRVVRLHREVAQQLGQAAAPQKQTR